LSILPIVYVDDGENLPGVPDTQDALTALAQQIAADATIVATAVIPGLSPARFGRQAISIIRGWRGIKPHGRVARHMPVRGPGAGKRKAGSRHHREPDPGI